MYVYHLKKPPYFQLWTCSFLGCSSRPWKVGFDLPSCQVNHFRDRRFRCWDIISYQHLHEYLVAQLCPTLCDPPARLLCPWDSPGKNTGVGCHSLLQEIFPTQGSNPGLLHCRRILYRLDYKGSPLTPELTAQGVRIARHISQSLLSFPPEVLVSPSWSQKACWAVLGSWI